jgi:alkylhydroperoxidase family enzyme
MRKGMRTEEYAHLAQSWSAAPGVAQAWMDSFVSAQRATGLDATTLELIECRLMLILKCQYVLCNHAVFLARASGWSHDEIKLNVQHPERSALTERDRTFLRFAEKAATSSELIAQDDIDGIRRLGLQDAQIVALIFVIGGLVQNAIFANALGPALDEFSKEFRDLRDW